LSRFALSTIWAHKRFDRLSDFFNAGQRMGFDCFELNYQVTPAMLNTIRPGDAIIVSFHAPCPSEFEIGGLSEADIVLSSTDEDRRQQAIAMTQATIDFAHRFGASAVVLHLGKVNIDPTIESNLRRLFREGLKGSEVYENICQRLIAARAERSKPHHEAAKRSLDDLAGYAEAARIRLGIECRYYYNEIPLLDEATLLLDRFPKGPIFYWHDTGHAQNLENLGLASHAEWLRAFGSRMLGIHLHDICDLDDHRPAGSGEIDFAMIARHVPAGAIQVCEFNDSASPAEVEAGRLHLEREAAHAHVPTLRQDFTPRSVRR
jgi:sugar phosphate isomerase/epimerase